MSNNSKKTPPPRVLSVDGDLDILLMLADMLKSEYHVDAVRRGVEAFMLLVLVCRNRLP